MLNSICIILIVQGEFKKNGISDKKLDLAFYL